ncbi:taste receptor type 2 member 40-like [Tiliqua scincoides]|uniref:taste receptor type 2 member 40-like n=1 Tax=Tiliqua scincoides TaxID=71010 RepID=UPI003462347A
MSTSIYAGFQVVTMTLSALGMATSVFIVAVACVDWMRKKKLTSCDLILICLSSSRFLLQGSMLHSVLFPEMDNWNRLRVHSIVLVMGSTACLWFAACLSVFYCIKVATFSQHFFLLMKMRISGMVPWLLLGSVLVSLISSLPFIWIDHSTYLCNATRSLLKNATTGNPFGSISYSKGFIMYLTWAIIPLLLFLTSSTLLITSLWRHTKQMRNSATVFKDASSEAHVTAIKALISFLILYICAFVAEILLGMPSCKAQSRSKDSICLLVIAACPLVHSMLLIHLNLRYKLALGNILLCMTFQLKKTQNYS